MVDGYEGADGLGWIVERVERPSSIERCGGFAGEPPLRAGATGVVVGYGPGWVRWGDHNSTDVPSTLIVFMVGTTSRLLARVLYRL
jgi:hypothetical protein